MKSREERRKIVIDLYKKGAGRRKIVSEAHMSPRDIQKIVEEIDPKERKLSIPTMALKMFNEGKDLMEVITSLDISFDEAKIIEQNYLTMQDRSKLAQLYDECENKEYTDVFITLFNSVKEKNLSKEAIDNVIYYSQQIPSLQLQLYSLVDEAIRQENRKMVLNSQISWIKIVIDRLSTNLTQIQSQIDNKQSYIDELVLTELKLRANVATQMDVIKRGTLKLDEMTQNISHQIFGKDEPILRIMFDCVINSLRNSQDRQLIKHIFDSDNAESQNSEYTLQSYSKLDEMFKDICASIRSVLPKIVEIYINSNQPGRLSPGTKNVGNNS